jgi:photosystem II oxygen-evolving enhancer protein 2
MAAQAITMASLRAPCALAKATFMGETASLKVSAPSVQKISMKGTRAQSDDAEDAAACKRRDVIWMAAMTAVGLSAAKPEPASAAYGEAANVFGKRTENTGYYLVQKPDFSIQVASKWNKSKEQDFGGVALRYEDNFDLSSHVVVLKLPAGGKRSITDYGSPENFIKEVGYILGEQTFSGETLSEGGFAKNDVATANILTSDESKDDSGTTYYKLDVLTRTADGTEGGRHNLISAAVKNGELYVCKVAVGDKRWFKGTDRFAKYMANSFSIA